MPRSDFDRYSDRYSVSDAIHGIHYSSNKENEHPKNVATYICFRVICAVVTIALLCWCIYIIILSVDLELKIVK